MADVWAPKAYRELARATDELRACGFDVELLAWVNYGLVEPAWRMTVRRNGRMSRGLIATDEVVARWVDEFIASVKEGR